VPILAASCWDQELLQPKISECG